MQNGKIPPSKIFDSENLGKFLAITRLSEQKIVVYGDVNFYFSTLLLASLEPIVLMAIHRKQLNLSLLFFMGTHQR